DQVRKQDADRRVLPASDTLSLNAPAGHNLNLLIFSYGLGVAVMIIVPPCFVGDGVGVGCGVLIKSGSQSPGLVNWTASPPGIRYNVTVAPGMVFSAESNSSAFTECDSDKPPLAEKS